MNPGCRTFKHLRSRFIFDNILDLCDLYKFACHKKKEVPCKDKKTVDSVVCTDDFTYDSRLIWLLL